MADFLPIKLGKNASGVVTHLQEISLSDKIPETYLQLSSNTIAKWNASSIQGSPVSSLLSPSANQVLIYTGSVWTASSIVTGGGGVTDHGALSGLDDDDHPQYVLSATNSALSSITTNHIASESVHFTQEQIHHGAISGLGDNDHPQYVLSATNSALSSLVDNHIASAVHWDLATLNTNYINASGDSANGSFYFQNVSGAVVSATTYQNLPVSSVVWASANYANFAGSATQALTASKLDSITAELSIVGDSDQFLVYSKAAGKLVLDSNIKYTTKPTALTYNVSLETSSDLNVSGNGNFYGSFVNIHDGDVNVTGSVIAQTVSATTYENIGNTTAKWNASALQGSPVSANLTPTANQSLVYNGSVWTASSIVTGGGGVTDHGALTGLADDDHPQYVLSATNSALSSTVSNHIASASVHFTQAQIDHGTIAGLADNDHPQYVLSATNSALSSLVDNHIASASVHFTQAQIDHGVILGLADNDHPQYVLSSTNSSLSSLVDSHIASASVHFTQAQIDHGVILGLADNDHPQYVLSATNSALSSLVSNHIASASVHFTQAEIDHGVILGLSDNDHPQYVLSATNSALSSLVNNHIASAVHWDLATLNANYINASGDSANAAFYFQTVSATTVSATTYLNVRPYVSAVDSATTTTVNINGDYDTYLVNTTTTGVTLYLPDASAYNNKKITVSKIDDGGSYRAVTLSGTQLQTATNTVLLYDPTESVTVISNGTSWYSMDYDRAYGVVVVCKNSTGSTLAKGTPVRVTGATGANVLIEPVSAANNHVPAPLDGSLSRCIGVVEHAIPDGEFGHVLTKGTLYKFNTDAYNEGDILYLAASGGFTNVKPAAPYDEVFLGIVTRKQAVNGSILIDVANPVHINDIVGFNLASSLISGDLISYDTATSTFTNVQAVNVSGQGKFGSVSATNYLNLPSGVATWNANKLQGYDISAVAPSNDQVLKYNSTLSAWVPGTDNTGGGGGGGISDASSLRGSPLSATLVPTAGQALMYNGSVWTASAALFAYTYGSGAPTGGSDGDIYLQTDVVALQVPSVSATNYYNLPSGTLTWTYATSATSALYATNATSATLALNATSATSALYSTNATSATLALNATSATLALNATSATLALNATSATLALNATSATSALNARQAPAGFDVTGMLTAASGDVSSTRLTDYSEKKSAPTISSSALTLDLTNSQVFTVALNSNISTLTISNPDPRTNTAQGFTLILTADGTARTITWPGSVKWPSGTGPTLTSTNNKVDILSFLSPDNGTTWYGFTGGQNF